jgi:hypothetical protein
VGEHIAIGMTDWTFIKRNRDAANDEGAACCESVQVVTNSAADFSHEKYSFLRGRKDWKANSSSSSLHGAEAPLAKRIMSEPKFRRLQKPE